MLPRDSKARKRIPLYRGLFKYFPDALAAVAELSFESNEKHNPGEPLHWSRDKSNDHGDTLLRHQLEAGTFDPDDRFLHDVKVAWRALAQAQIAIEENGGWKMEGAGASEKPPAPGSLIPSFEDIPPNPWERKR